MKKTEIEIGALYACNSDGYGKRDLGDRTLKICRAVDRLKGVRGVVSIVLGDQSGDFPERPPGVEEYHLEIKTVHIVGTWKDHKFLQELNKNAELGKQQLEERKMAEWDKNFTPIANCISGLLEICEDSNLKNSIGALLAPSGTSSYGIKAQILRADLNPFDMQVQCSVGFLNTIGKYFEMQGQELMELKADMIRSKYQEGAHAN